MQTTPQHSEKIYQLTVDTAGRLVLPVDSHVRQACRDGDKLIAVEDVDGRLSIFTYGDMVREVQSHFKTKIPAGVSVVDELLAERRREALHE